MPENFILFSKLFERHEKLFYLKCVLQLLSVKFCIHKVIFQFHNLKKNLKSSCYDILDQHIFKHKCNVCIIYHSSNLIVDPLIIPKGTFP